MVYMLLFGVVAAGALALFTARALRSEHLLLLRWRKGGLFLFARQEDGRYALLTPLRVPAAVAGFAWRELTGTLDAVPGRVARKLPARGVVPRRGAAHA